MLKKLRLKFVCYTMIIVTVMLCVIFGLGLPIAKAIVEDHGGKIWAASDNGVNTFFINLPML